MSRYEVARSTVDGTQHELFDSATLVYADANEHALGTVQTIEYYKEVVVEIKLTYAGNTADKDLTFGIATSNYELTGANAISQLDSAYWSTKVIDLNTSGGTSTEYYLITIPASDIKGKYLYSKYQYEGEPTNDPTVEVKLNFI